MNSEVIIREARPDEIAEWDKLTRGFGDHRVTHTLAWLRSLDNSIKGQLLFLVYEKKGRVAACLPGMIINFGFLRLYGSPLPGWQTVSMGPVFDKVRITTAEIIEPLSSFLERKYGIHHIEIMCSGLDREVMDKSGFRGRPEYTFQTPLFPKDEKKALQAMKTSARRNIVRGAGLGLTVKFRDDDGFVDEVYEQISEVFLRGGNVVPFAKTRVTEFFLNMKESGNLIAVSVHLPESDICIATGLFTIENKELLLWMWSHRTEYRWFRPTELLTWTVMQKAMQLGCESFDFMGRGDFKAKFGAKLDGNKIRWVRSRYSWLTVARDLSEKLYRLQQSVRGRYSRRRSNAPVTPIQV